LVEDSGDDGSMITKSTAVKSIIEEQANDEDLA